MINPRDNWQELIEGETLTRVSTNGESAIEFVFANGARFELTADLPTIDYNPILNGWVRI